MKVRNAWRYGRWVAATTAVAMVAAGAVGLAAGTPAAVAAVDPGVGSSYAQGLQVTPHEGSLAVGAVFDEALAGHTDKIARAQSQGLDLGAVGESIRGYNCGQPPSALANYVPEPLQAETPSGGGTDQASAGPSPSDNNSYGSVEHVLATDTPYGEADTTLGGQIAAPGNLVTVSSVVSKAWSGLVHGDRVAGATVDIGAVGIAGVVELSGLHWEATYPSGASGDKPSASFQIARAVVNGTTVPTADVSALADVLNAALQPLGIQLAFPAVSSAQGIEFLSPLQVEVVPSSTRDSLVDPLITKYLEPNYYPIANGLENGFANTSPPYNSLGAIEPAQLAQALCQSDTPITVLDVTLASFTAGGYFNIGLGGVNASSGDLPTNPYDLAPFGLGSLSAGGSTEIIPGIPGTPGTPAIAGNAGSPVVTGDNLGGSAAPPSGSSAPAATGASPDSRPDSIATISNEASGPLLAVGLGVLGLLALLAEADRRMIRRGSATAVFEE